MTNKFETRVPGKFILTGEHAVLRGIPAVVFPLSGFHLELRYQATPSGPSDGVEIRVGPHQNELRQALWSVLERAQKLAGHRGEFMGIIEVQSQIPVGSGLGASAALTVAVARLCQYLGWIGAEDLLDFAREMENIFHGESSGVDVAAVHKAQPLIYVRGVAPKVFSPLWRPTFILRASGSKGLTSDCIARVKRLWETDLPRARQIDEMMRQSSLLSVQAMTELSAEKGLGLLAEALSMGRECFSRWGLETPEMKASAEELLRRGCLAVKPTGSGAGGYVLGLWPQGKTPPDSDLVIVGTPELSETF